MWSDITFCHVVFQSCYPFTNFKIFPYFSQSIAFFVFVCHYMDEGVYTQFGYRDFPIKVQLLISKLLSQEKVKKRFVIHMYSVSILQLTRAMLPTF